MDVEHIKKIMDQEAEKIVKADLSNPPEATPVNPSSLSELELMFSDPKYLGQEELLFASEDDLEFRPPEKQKEREKKAKKPVDKATFIASRIIKK